MLVISHDREFLEKLEPTHVITVRGGRVDMQERALREDDWCDDLNSREASTKFASPTVTSTTATAAPSGNAKNSKKASKKGSNSSSQGASVSSSSGSAAAVAVTVKSPQSPQVPTAASIGSAASSKTKPNGGNVNRQITKVHTHARKHT